MRDEILLVFAKRDGRSIAGALNFIGADTLYGRYWGALEEHPCLHFEVCYYQAIDFAIAHKLARVEAGAQGAHKLARGYLPVPTYSAHWIRDPGLRRAVADYLRRERAAVSPRDRTPRRGVALPAQRYLVMAAKRASSTTAQFRIAGKPAMPVDCCNRILIFWLTSAPQRLEMTRENASEASSMTYDPNNVFAKVLRGELPCPQDLRGRGHACLPRHHAARRRPRTGDHQGEGPRPVRRVAAGARQADGSGAEARARRSRRRLAPTAC